jgi:hypothetical protein
MFLATPHRGTKLAELLNRILTVSIFNHSPRQYISELNKGSSTLEDLNEQFRHVAPKMQIFSFYETLPTVVGPKKIVRTTLISMFIPAHRIRWCLRKILQY